MSEVLIALTYVRYAILALSFVAAIAGFAVIVTSHRDERLEDRVLWLAVGVMLMALGGVIATLFWSVA